MAFVAERRRQRQMLFTACDADDEPVHEQLLDDTLTEASKVILRLDLHDQYERPHLYSLFDHIGVVFGSQARMHEQNFPGRSFGPLLI